MKKLLLLVLLMVSGSIFSQTGEDSYLTAKVVNAQNGTAMPSVHVLNLNQVLGTITNDSGDFRIPAVVNDTLYFSFLCYKSIKIRVTNDMLKFEGTKIEMTELAFALEEVVVQQYQLTGYLDIDAKNVPINNAYRYSISGLNTGYEAKKGNPGAISKVLGAIFNPADFLYNIFGNKPNQMRKLRKMKEEDEIRDLLVTKFDRETLTELLQIDKSELEEILRHCNYSKDFIYTANDLQILDAISGCYEEYKVLNRKK